jgi:peptide/nickel transport system ATP-binding protein
MASNFPPLAQSASPFVRVRGLSKHYSRGGLLGARHPITAIDRIDFEIPQATTMALVGESGSGKSTVARCVVGLEKPDSGQVCIGDEEVAEQPSPNPDPAKRTDSRKFPFSRRAQMVFQDPVTSMNPRFTAAQIVEEPLLIGGLDAVARNKAAAEIMTEVGLSPEWLSRSVMEFSGGQRQRLAIARALILRPKLLVLDEALTGLDLSTQAQITNLLLDLRAAHSLTCLLISHDLTLVARVAASLAVMSRGRIVESGPISTMMTAAKHEETLRLLSGARAVQSNFRSIAETTA